MWLVLLLAVWASYMANAITLVGMLFVIVAPRWKAKFGMVVISSAICAWLTHLNALDMANELDLGAPRFAPRLLFILLGMAVVAAVSGGVARLARGPAR